MNKQLKYETNKLKRTIETCYPIDLYILALFELFQIYQIENPIVVDFKEDYEYLNLFIRNKSLESKNCIISINLLNLKEMKIKFCSKKYFDMHEIEGNLFLTKRVFEQKDQKIEKLYTRGSKEKQVLIKKEGEYVRYKYIYTNPFLKSTFSITFLKSCPFKESLFIKRLLEEGRKISSIEDLYTLVRDLIGIQDLDISISNETPYGKESFLVQENTLKSFRKVIQEGEMLQIIEYDGVNLREMRIQNPDTSEVLQSMKRLIKERKNSKK